MNLTIVYVAVSAETTLWGYLLGDILGAPWGTLGISWRYLGGTLGARSWGSCHHHTVLGGVYPGCILGVSCGIPGNILGVSWEYHRVLQAYFGWYPCGILGASCRCGHIPMIRISTRRSNGPCRPNDNGGLQRGGQRRVA